MLTWRSISHEKSRTNKNTVNMRSGLLNYRSYESISKAAAPGKIPLTTTERGKPDCFKGILGRGAKEE